MKRLPIFDRTKGERVLAQVRATYPFNGLARIERAAQANQTATFWHPPRRADEAKSPFAIGAVEAPKGSFS